MKGKPAISVKNFNLTYTGTRENPDNYALKNININFPRNRLTTIIGPSGCGKSSLLKSLNRLHDLNKDVKTSGEVYLGNTPVYKTSLPVPEIRKKIGYVPQKPTPLPMSIYKNVAYGPRIHSSYSSCELNSLVETYLRKVNLWAEVKDRLHSPAAELSVGQIQRLCLARTLAIEPEVILCDEVTSALDPISSKKVEKTLSQLKTDYTIIMVTHLLHQAERLADYVVFLYLGETIEKGPADSILKNPEHRLTKEFVKG
jgi:phosphate transport system ATP-binding protein